jgi:MFS family permease
MAGTGLGFAGLTDFWPLLVVAFAGTLNPSGGDVSVFLPVEQSLLTTTVADRQRTSLFARYNLGGTFAAALGALCSGLPVYVARRADLDLVDVERAAFLIYGVVALTLAAMYLRLERVQGTLRGRGAPLAQSRGIVLRLSALFSLDSLGGGLVVQSLLALWLFQRYDLSLGVTGAIFFAAGLLSASSQLAAAWLAERIGLIRTMVYTHLPANLFLVAAALMPNVWLAVSFLLLRMSLSQMDVPARQSYTMAVVPPEERVAAASVTNVPRSLAAATTPLLAGVMLNATTFGWPLIAAGLIKAVYDLLLLWQFRAIRPPEELRDVGVH